MKFFAILVDTAIKFGAVALITGVIVGLFILWAWMMDDHPKAAILLIAIIAIIGISIAKYYT